MTEAMGPREQMPAWRKGVCVPLECQLSGNHFRFDAHFNFYPDGRLGEMFAHPFKTGADLGGLLDKFCIAVSKLLQRGERISEFWQTIDDGRPADHRDILMEIVAGGVAEEKLAIAKSALDGGK